MLEAAQILGCLAAALLVVAVAVWVKLLRGPVPQKRSGVAAQNLGGVEMASQLLFLTAVLSAVAAGLAMAGLIAG